MAKNSKLSKPSGPETALINLCISGADGVHIVSVSAESVEALCGLESELTFKEGMALKGRAGKPVDCKTCLAEYRMGIR